MNAYVTVDALKGALDIAGAEDDARLLRLIEAASRAADAYCNRSFYALRAAKLFDGDGGRALLTPDLIAIDDGGLWTDDDLDGAFETAWAAGDYVLLPANADPASASNPASRPFTRIEARAGAGRRFPAGRLTVRAAGTWGWWQHLARAGESLAADAAASDAAITVSERADVEAGHTVLIGSEQMYVRSYDGNALAVVRGANGTTAAAHASGAPIDVFEYPPGVSEAVAVQASRLLRRGDGAYAAPSGPRGSGRGAPPPDADSAFLLAGYRRASLGVGVR